MTSGTTVLYPTAAAAVMLDVTCPVAGGVCRSSHGLVLVLCVLIHFPLVGATGMCGVAASVG